MRANRIFGVLFIAALSACGGGDSTTAPVDATLNGTWSGTVTNVAGSGVSCGMTGLVMQLTQTDTTVTGSYTVSLTTCSGAGGSQSGGPFAGSIVNGTITGTAVAFDMDTQELHFTGSKSGNTLTGSTVWTLDLGAPTGIVMLIGSWSATR